MNKYRIFKIENKDGVSISNHESYTKMGNAKNAANNCVWRMDEDSNIVEYEITEIPVNKTKINVEIITSTRPNWRGEPQEHTSKRIIGYDLQTKETPVQIESKISFNK